jgi:hypothetical protein
MRDQMVATKQGPHAVDANVEIGHQGVFHCDSLGGINVCEAKGASRFDAFVCKRSKQRWRIERKAPL